MTYLHIIRFALVTSLLALSLHGEDQAPARTVRIIDEDGKPLAGVKVRFRESAGGVSGTTGGDVTDADGKVTLHPRSATWKVVVDREGGGDCSVGVGILHDGIHPCLTTDWRDPKWQGVCFEELWIDGNYDQQANFELAVRKPGEITSPRLAKELRRLLQECLDHGSHADALSQMCNNLEHYDDLDLLAQIAAKHPELAATVATILDEDTQNLADYWTVLNVKHSRYDDPGGWEVKYSALCHWRGLDDNRALLDATLPKLQAELQKITDSVLDAAEAVWPSRGIVAFPHLGKHAVARVPRFLQVMENAGAHFIAWQWLQKCDPTVDQVRPFFQSRNPFVAFAAIACVSGKLTPADATTALAKLRSLANPGMPRTLPPYDPAHLDAYLRQNDANYMEEQLEKLIPQIEARAAGNAPAAATPPPDDEMDE